MNTFSGKYRHIPHKSEGTISKRFMADFQENHMIFAEKSYTASNLCGISDVFLEIM